MNQKFYYDVVERCGNKKLKKLYKDRNRALTRTETTLIARLAAAKEAYDREYESDLGFSFECREAFTAYKKVNKTLVRLAGGAKRYARTLNQVDFDLFEVNL